MLDGVAVSGLIERIAGKKYAEKFIFSQIEPLNKGMDRYSIEDTKSKKILIKATSGVAAACAFKWYLENRCGSYVGPLTKRLNLPENPPDSTFHSDESLCLYRYFLNYCTYGYTLVFWDWDRWQQFLDWMMMAGYNLVLNPLAHEVTWLNLLAELGYTKEKAKAFLCAPTFFPWQCMMNLTSWGGAAPDSWYEGRLQLCRKVNSYLKSFGAGVVLPGYSGMVPADFKEHYPEAEPIGQGGWCGMQRPGILLPDDSSFKMVAESFYRNQKELLGEDFHYFSTDPFHEGGDSSSVNLTDYAKTILDCMYIASDNPVWFLQGWSNNPIREMLCALPAKNVLIANLKSTTNINGGDNFAGYPWLYCCVNNFGGQRVMRGNIGKMTGEMHAVLSDCEYTAVGIGMLPEGIECDEILFDAFSTISLTKEPLNADKWLKKQLAVRYGICSDNTFKGWKLLRDKVYINDTEAIPLESSLLTRPSLTVGKVSTSSSDKHSYNPLDLYDAFKILMRDYGSVPTSDTYRLDMLDIARQVIDYKGWEYLKGIQITFNDRNEEEFEKNAKQFMCMYDVVEKLLSCDKHTLLGVWLESAVSYGKTVSEKAYFEFIARTLVTLWGDRGGASVLRDYAAKEWNGLIEDFYRPRWQSYINILRRSFVTGEEPREYNRYDSEYFFTTLSKSYPTEPYGDFDKALYEVLKII